MKRVQNNNQGGMLEHGARVVSSVLNLLFKECAGGAEAGFKKRSWM
jgi:hypothetical protein